jgi:hypothetical protein
MLVNPNVMNAKLTLVLMLIQLGELVELKFPKEVIQLHIWHADP